MPRPRKSACSLGAKRAAQAATCGSVASTWFIAAGRWRSACRCARSASASSRPRSRPITVFARDFGSSRNTGDVFEPIAPDQRGVVARAACGDVYGVGGAQHRFGLGAEKPWLQRARTEDDLECIGERARLLVDLLLHI